MKRISFVTAVLVLAGVVGCNNRNEGKEKVTQQWNAARAGVMYGMAKQQYEGGDFDKARKTTDDALKIQPKSVALLILSAKLSIEQAQLEVAEASLKKAIEIDATNAE